jgi:hypothetical protein
MATAGVACPAGTALVLESHNGLRIGFALHEFNQPVS